MMRWIVSILIAHVAASYAVLLSVSLYYGWQGDAGLLIAPIWSPHVVWSSTVRAAQFTHPVTNFLVIVGTYLVVAAAVLRLRLRRGDRAFLSGFCPACGYDLRATP